MKNNNSKGRSAMFIKIAGFPFLRTVIFLFLIFGPFIQFKVSAQMRAGNKIEPVAFAYDQVPVLVMIEGCNDFYVDALCTNNDLLYINVADLFKMLNINCIIGQRGTMINGFIDKESRIYSIDWNTHLIKIDNKVVNPHKLLLNEMGNIYLESNMFSELFGMGMSFNFSSFTLMLKPVFELPILKQQRIEKMQKNLSKVKGDEAVDTTLQRNYHFLKFGTLDWALASTQSWNGKSDNQFGFNIGTEFLFGDATFSVYHDDHQKFDNRQVQYLWRWINNDKTFIKQAQIGKISTQTISFLNNQVVGAVIRNTPTTVRKAKGYYMINEMTEPNWTIELYLNNILVDFTKSDASGSFRFKVPIVYGYTTVKLKFYGTMGEERTEERTLNVPSTFMPVNEFEYGLSVGMVQDSIHSRFGKGEFNYGVNRFLTIGGGVEYLTSIPAKPFIPYATAAFQPFNNMTLSTEFAYGVRSRGLLNYYFWKDALLEVDFAKYVPGQQATHFNSLEERKVKLSVPFKYKKISAFSKIDFSQFIYKTFNYHQTGVMFSLYYKQFNFNSTTQLNWIGHHQAYCTTDLSFSSRLKMGFILRTSSQYNTRDNKIMTYNFAIERNYLRGNFSLSYTRNPVLKSDFVSLNFKYDLKFARTNLSFAQTNNHFYTSEGAQGSLAFGSGNNYIYGSRNSADNKGGIALFPFLDLNNNGIYDKGEPMVRINSAKIMGSKVIFSEKDSIVRIPELNAFTNYVVEFIDNDLDNFAWRFKKKKFSVLIDPQQFKRVYVPIVAVGEISGMVYLKNDSIKKGIGGVVVKLYKRNCKTVNTQTLSEVDGSLSFTGVEPGEYVARIDSAQLTNLEYTADHSQIYFTVKKLIDGDLVKGIDFVLQPLQNDSLILPNNDLASNAGSTLNDAKKILEHINPVMSMTKEKMSEKDSMFMKAQSKSSKLTKDLAFTNKAVFKHRKKMFTVQLLTRLSPLKSPRCFANLVKALPELTIFGTFENNKWYLYKTGILSSYTKALKLKHLIIKNGWMDCFINNYFGDQNKGIKLHFKN